MTRAPNNTGTALKRSGAIRRPANQLNRSETTQATSAQRTEETRFMAGPLRRAATDSNPSDSGNEDWFHNIPDQDLEVQLTSDELSEALFYYMDYEQRQRLWRDFLIWDSHGIRQLVKTLKLWVNLQLPADKVGEFLEDALYQRDDHMNKLVTAMVNNNETYTLVALRVMEYYQIYDVSDRPAWEIMKPGDIDRHAGFKRLNRVLPPRRLTQVEPSTQQGNA
ncbi:uncharacterized protein N7459_005895 [Penicillium hispanicum]|uniref:uncharacterized protein n=1 Tax=Penicillium hispanicum TaxID=1080232 RepID=UPI0025418884|nr:uncharacterized protein N7459_005895 [Penicillium hispanicum]KAJ5579910.1 hypothetical protein N7459_005895 [Penicillium hispanicum]